MATVLLCFPATSYRPEAWIAAAEKRGVALHLATDRPGATRRYAEGSSAVRDVTGVDFAALEASLEALSGVEVEAVAAVDERSAALAARFAEARGTRAYHSVQGVEAARDKRLMRARLREAGVKVPDFCVWAPGEPLPEPTYPCVVKPSMLSGSQGVIRADDPDALAAAVARVQRIVARHPSDLSATPGFDELLVETFVAGPEVAVEGLVTAGQLDVLTIFDKPDPLEGPYFEETLYVTPSRRPEAAQRRVIEVTGEAVRALGLTDGPIHAELRLAGLEGGGGGEPVVLEIAARSIGGLCARALFHVLGGDRGPGSLEALLLDHALGRRAQRPPPAGASGVMMLPVPRSGVLKAVHGLEEARAVPFVDAVQITIEPGQAVRGLPEGNSYLGFAFAHADGPAVVERALRRAHGQLRFDLAPLLATY